MDCGLNFRFFRHQVLSQHDMQRLVTQARDLLVVMGDGSGQDVRDFQAVVLLGRVFEHDDCPAKCKSILQEVSAEVEYQIGKETDAMVRFLWKAELHSAKAFFC